jgi:hypothetical protein
VVSSISSMVLLYKRCVLLDRQGLAVLRKVVALGVFSGTREMYLNRKCSGVLGFVQIKQRDGGGAYNIEHILLCWSEFPQLRNSAKIKSIYYTVFIHLFSLLSTAKTRRQEDIGIIAIVWLRKKIQCFEKF